MTNKHTTYSIYVTKSMVSVVSMSNRTQLRSSISLSHFTEENRISASVRKHIHKQKYLILCMSLFNVAHRPSTFYYKHTPESKNWKKNNAGCCERHYF